MASQYHVAQRLPFPNADKLLHCAPVCEAEAVTAAGPNSGSTCTSAESAAITPLTNV